MKKLRKVCLSFISFLSFSLVVALMSACTPGPERARPEGHLPVATDAADHISPLPPSLPPPPDIMPLPAVVLPPEEDDTLYTVRVHQAPVAELLLALAKDAGLQMDVDADVDGQVSVHAEQRPLRDILERIADVAGLRLRTDADRVLVLPDKPFFLNYRVSYPNLTRGTQTLVRTITQISTPGGTEGGGDTGSTSTTDISSDSVHDFWAALPGNIEQLLQQEEGPSPVIVANPAGGLLAVRATGRQHETVRRFLDDLLLIAHRQVLIEATIVEVALTDSKQTGIEWSLLNGKFDADIKLSADETSTSNPTVVLDYGGGNGTGFGVVLRLLRQFGETQVLSSPRLMALNNQTALLKVVDNLVYFNVDQQTTLSVQGSSESTSSTEVHTVPVGLVMSITPHIADDGNVLLNVRPSVSRVTRFITDPNPALVDVDNRVPEIQVREMETVLRLSAGEVAVLGGLIRDDQRDNRRQIPWLSDIPGLGRLFSGESEEVRRTEMVVLLRAALVP